MNKYLAYSSLLLIVCMSIIYPLYFYQKNKLIRQAAEHLNAVANQREQILINYFEKYRKRLTTLAEDPHIIKALNNFKKLVHNTTKSPSYQATEQTLNSYLNNNLSNEEEYKNLFLVSTDGTVVYSRQERPEFGVNLLQHSSNLPGFSECVTRVLMTFTYDYEETSYYPPTKRAALFILVPIFQNRRLEGIIAIEFGQHHLLSLLTNYKDLGRTGEVIIADWNKGAIKFISNVRHSFYASADSIENSLKANSPIMLQKLAQGQKVVFTGGKAKILKEATLGNELEGISKDYRGYLVYAVGRYYAPEDWGIAIEMELSEILEPLFPFELLANLVTILACIVLFMMLFLSISSFLPALNYFSLGSFMLAGVMCIGALYFGYQYNNIIARTLQPSTEESVQSLANVKQRLTNNLRTMQYFATELAHSITGGQIEAQNYSTYIKRVLNENKQITAFALAYKPESSTTRPYTPYGIRDNDNVKLYQFEHLTNHKLPQENQEALWYHKAITGNALWIDTYREPLTGTITTVFATPFYSPGSKQPSGVIAIMYNFSTIQEMVEDIYASLISNTGQFLVDYSRRYIQTKKTLDQLTAELNDSLLNAFNKVIKLDVSEYTFYNKEHKTYEALYVDKIPFLEWTLVIQYREEHYQFPYKKLQHYEFWFITFMALAGIFFINGLFFFSKLTLLLYCLSMITIFTLGILALFIVIYRNVTALNIPEVPIEYEVSLHYFLKELNEDAYLHGQGHFIPIKTGILVNYIDLKQSLVSLTSVIWQKYLKNSTIKPNIIFPQASKTTLTAGEHYTRGENSIRTWYAYNELFQNQDFTYYPFDIRKVEIVFEHPDNTHNIILIPDLETYSCSKVETSKGVNTTAHINGFYIRKSFFDYQLSPTVSFNPIVRPALTYTILLQRSLLNPFVVYFLPLLIILILLFTAIFTLEKEEALATSTKLRALSVFTSLLFALVLLHRNLRNDLQVEKVIYIEYFFFYTYITLFILTLYTIFVKTGIKINLKNIQVSLITFIYWPLELLMWFITTIVIFY